MYAEDWAPIVGIGIFIVVLCLGIGCGINHSVYVSRTAEIGQLRRDVTRVDVAESEDVIGQVTQANQEIASWQRWDQVPVIQIMIPNGWNREALIELPVRPR